MLPRSKTFGSKSEARDLRGTPVSRQGYLPDLEPLTGEHELGALLLVPRSATSPSPLDLAGPHGLRRELFNEDTGSLAKGDTLQAAIYDRVGLWGTVWNMCSATLGAGALSLPFAFQHLGAAGGALAIALTASAAHYSVSLLVGAITVTRATSYEQLTVYCFGKTMGVIVEVNILVFCFGSVIAYTVAVGDLLEPLLLLKPVQHAAPWLDRRLVMCIFWASCMLPLSLVERLSALQVSAYCGLWAVGSSAPWTCEPWACEQIPTVPSACHSTCAISSRRLPARLTRVRSARRSSACVLSSIWCARSPSACHSYPLTAIGRRGLPRIDSDHRGVRLSRCSPWLLLIASDCF